MGTTVEHTLKRWSVVAAAVGLALALAGCGAFSGLVGGENSSGEQPTDAPAPSASAPSTEDAARAFYDNLVVYRQMAHQSDAAQSSWKTPPEGTWSEVDASTRELYVTVGEETCNSGFADDGGLAEGSTDVFMAWLSARFLCPEHREAAETALVEFTSQNMLDALEYSVLRGNASTEDVMIALITCEAAIDIAYDLPEGYDKGYFCWMMRVNSIAESDDENDFIALFDGANGDTNDDAFDALARELGATPNSLSGLLEE